MQLIHTSTKNLEALSDLVALTNYSVLTQHTEILFGSSIGMHIRHILEFYTCLLDQENNGIVCYDKRKRNLLLEQSPEFIQETIARIIDSIGQIREDKLCTLQMSFSTDSEDMETFESTLYRELVSCFEHMVHHLATIKIALRISDPTVVIPENLGVACSTIRQKKVCAQ